MGGSFFAYNKIVLNQDYTDERIIGFEVLGRHFTVNRSSLIKIYLHNSLIRVILVQDRQLL